MQPEMFFGASALGVLMEREVRCMLWFVTERVVLFGISGCLFPKLVFDPSDIFVRVGGGRGRVCELHIMMFNGYIK